MSAPLLIFLLLSPAAGGMGAHVAALARGYAARGHQVVLATDQATAARYDFQSPTPGATPVKVMSFPTLPKRASRQILTALAGADLVHANGHQAAVVARLWEIQLRVLMGPVGVLASRLAPYGQEGRAGQEVSPAAGERLGAAPRFVSWHNDFLTAGWKGKLRLRAAAFAVQGAQVVSGASSDLAELAASLGARHTFVECPPSPRLGELLQAERLPAAQRAQRRQELFAHTETVAHLDPQLPLILTVARWAPQKQLDWAARAAQHLPGGYNWVVLGDGEEDQAAQARELARGAKSEFILAGRQDNVGQWLEAADCFALTSRWEGRPLVVQEAMAAGVPCVTSAAGGMIDLLEGGCGTLVSAPAQRSEESESEKVEAFARDFARALTLAAGPKGQEMAAAARRRAAAFPSIEQVVSDWLERYRMS